MSSFFKNGLSCFNTEDFSFSFSGVHKRLTLGQVKKGLVDLVHGGVSSESADGDGGGGGGDGERE